MSTGAYKCCACCEGDALSDHVGQGGTVEKDQHDEPCTTCIYMQGFADGKAAAT